MLSGVLPGNAWTLALAAASKTLAFSVASFDGSERAQVDPRLTVAIASGSTPAFRALRWNSGSL
jgi:hypothetical protein